MLSSTLSRRCPDLLLPRLLSCWQHPLSISSVPPVNQGPSKTLQHRGFSQLQHTGWTSIHRCQSTNTLLCCCEQWIQNRPLDCRLQRFHAWVGRLGAQVQGTFFRFVWMVWLFLSAVFLCLFSLSFLFVVCPSFFALMSWLVFTVGPVLVLHWNLGVWNNVPIPFYQPQFGSA